MEKQTNNDFKNMLIGFGVILLYLIGSTFTYEFISLLGINYNNLSTLGKSICIICYEAILTIIIIYIYKKDFITNFKEFIKDKQNYLGKYFKYWILILVLMITSNIIVTNFTSSEVAANQESIIESLKKFPLYTFIVTVIIAPILEELVFRLSFRKIFAKTNILFIFFSGFIFGLMHVIGNLTTINDFLFIIPYSIPGFIFAYVYSKSKNIFTPIGLHLIHNSVMMFMQILLIITQKGA